MILPVIAAILTAAAAPAPAPAAAPPEGYQLVWSDEFDTDGRPDPQKWDYERGFVRNEEAQWYQPENAWVENGFLVIEGRRERKPNPRYQAGSTDWKTKREFAEYTSASLRTLRPLSWRYGRFEMRGRIDTRAGLWPAWWALGTQWEWPSCGEIDMMEFYRGTLLANVAWGTNRRWVGAWHTVKKPIAEFNDPEWSKKLHVWRMDWDDEAIKLYVDDVLLNTTLLRDTLNADKTNPFNNPAYMILNLAIGGQSGGDPSKTEFPARFEVDYVRVYQKK